MNNLKFVQDDYGVISDPLNAKLTIIVILQFFSPFYFGIKQNALNFFHK